MTEIRSLETPLFDPQRSRRRALGLLLALLAVHLWAVWGYVGTFWSDQGVWLHVVDRYARGEAPYLDFDWPYPPLALWIVGALARVTGTALAALMAISSAIALLVFLAYYRIVTRVAAGTALPVVLTGIVFATAYASGHGTTLVLSAGTPGGLLGILFLLAALALAVEVHERPARWLAGATGALCALAMLTRRDLWIPALAVALWSGWTIGEAQGSRRTMTTLWTALGGTLVAGVLIAVAASGGAVMPALLPAGIGEALASGAPSWERLTVEVAAAAAMGMAGVVALWLCFALDDRLAGRIGGALLCAFLSACAIHLGMTIAIAHDVMVVGGLPGDGPLREAVARILAAGRSPMRVALYLLDQRFQLHLFPTILPPILLAVLLLRWRRWSIVRDRDLTLLLLTLAVALRLRRGLAGADWYNVLIEIPAFAIFLHLVAAEAGRQAHRAVSMAVAILLVVGLYTYYTLGRGPLTVRRYATLATARGAVRWPDDDAALYQAVRRIVDGADPGGQRPLLAFGPTGGWNYFLGRGNPTRFTRGFVDPRDADGVRALLRAAPGAFVVDNRAMIQLAPPRRPSLARWETGVGNARAEPLQHPSFAAIVAGCREIGAVPGPPRVPVYDCATRPGSSR